MTTHNITAQQVKVLDELIDNAIGLPVDSQDLLLMMAKAMRCTRDCMVRQNLAGEPHNPPKQTA